ncbi:MAG: HlyD family efflux transporter periplasmic adaptor subunit [Gammaproteobacteria bacterium]|nr:HlyD family efflux transporter periplasmic adaptor subunit [Gammaproteobacteria bacterium]
MKETLIIFAAVLTIAACDSNRDGNRVVGELASDRIELTAEFSDAIVEIVAAEGDSVSGGDVLLRQDAARAQARLAEADAGYLQARARLDELLRGPRSEKIAAARAAVEGATQDLDFRQSEFTRTQEIHARGLSSPDALDKASAALDAAQATLKQQLAQLEELLAGTTVEELAQAEQAVKQAQARRDAAEIDLERHTLIAPVDGVVDSRLFEIGERPGIGQPVLVMLGGAQPYARVYVPENLRVQIKSGTPARVFVDGLERTIAGRVRWIASESAFTPYFALTERDRGRLSYVAKVDILDETARLPDGVPVEVEFELN